MGDSPRFFQTALFKQCVLSGFRQSSGSIISDRLCRFRRKNVINLSTRLSSIFTSVLIARSYAYIWGLPFFFICHHYYKATKHDWFYCSTVSVSGIYAQRRYNSTEGGLMIVTNTVRLSASVL